MEDFKLKQVKDAMVAVLDDLSEEVCASRDVSETGP